jgi:uncharacterized membrane protein
LPSEIDQLRAEIQNLSSRIAHIERRLDISDPAETAVPAERAPVDTGALVSVKLINRIGALTLAIGIVFFFKYAVDNRWIGALGRVLLGLIAGLFLIAVADWLRRRNQQVFSQGVAGCGLAAIFISIYAAFAYYGLASQTVGFIGLVLTCAGAVALSIVYGVISIAALGFIGAVLTSLLLRTKGDPPLELYFPYLLLVIVTAVVITVRQRWTALSPITTSFTLLAALILIDEHHPNGFIAFCLVAAALHFAAAFGVRGTPGVHDSLYVLGHASLLLGLIRMVALSAVHHTAPADQANVISELESFLIAAYGAVVLLIALSRKTNPDRILAGVLLSIVVAKLYLWDVWQLKTFYLISAFVALGIFLLIASFAYTRFRGRTSP